VTTVILRLNEGDATVDTHLKRLKKGNGGAQVITVKTGISKLGDMKKGDKLIVIGHGSTKTLGKLSAQQIAELFSKNDMPSGVNIELVACKGGAGGAPLALELKTQLVSKKIVPGQVTGGTNNMKVKRDGTPYTKTPGKTGTEIHAGTETVDTPWGQRRRNVNPTYRTN
jgi:hypothetical protein